jgi:hypothetical protein
MTRTTTSINSGNLSNLSHFLHIFFHDLNTSMNQLFNEKVVSAQPVSREMGNSASGIGLPGSHTGTRVTTESGGGYLIHHGSGFAAPGSNPTVITNASNMSSKWNSIGDAYNPGTSVGSMMGTGQGYNVFKHNCNDVTAGMPNSSVDTTSTFGISTGIKPNK